MAVIHHDIDTVFHETQFRINASFSSQQRRGLWWHIGRITKEVQMVHDMVFEMGQPVFKFGALELLLKFIDKGVDNLDCKAACDFPDINRKLSLNFPLFLQDASCHADQFVLMTFQYLHFFRREFLDLLLRHGPIIFERNKQDLAVGHLLHSQFMLACLFLKFVKDFFAPLAVDLAQFFFFISEIFFFERFRQGLLQLLDQ